MRAKLFLTGAAGLVLCCVVVAWVANHPETGDPGNSTPPIRSSHFPKDEKIGGMPPQNALQKYNGEQRPQAAEVMQVRQEDKAALKQIVAVDDFFERVRLLRDYFIKLNGSNSEYAAACMAWLEPKDRDYEAIEIIAKALAEKDVYAALRFGASMNDYRVEDFVKQKALEIWAKKDPAAAAKHVLATEAPDRQARVLGFFAKSWGSVDPAAAMEVASVLSDPQSWSYYTACVFDGWSLSNPEEAALAFQDIKESRQGFASLIAKNWAAHSPEKAFEWSVSLPSGDEARSAAISTATGYIAARDPDKAAELINAHLAESPDRDLAVNAFINNMVFMDPDTASEWAVTIRDPGMRLNALRGVVYQKAQVDKKMASAWLDGLQNIPPSWKMEFTRVIGDTVTR